MKATPIPILLRQPGGNPRGDGIHLSGITRCMAVEMGILDAKYVEDMSLMDTSREDWWDSLDEPTKIRMSIGLAWEQFYIATQLDGVMWQPGEMCVDGIYMNHDGEGLDVIITPTQQLWVPSLHEVKTTSKSTKTVGDMTTQWMWQAQTKGYLKGLSEKYSMPILRGYIHVLFLRGNWKFPYDMEIRCWQLDYTQEEIDCNWEDHIDYVRQRRIEEREDVGLESGT